MLEVYGSASEWRMVTGGTHEGPQGAPQPHGVDREEECECEKTANGLVACTLEEGHQHKLFLTPCR